MYPQLHRFTEKPQNRPSEEVIPLAQARFIDRLEPENEALWNEMVTKAHEAELSLDDFVIPVWSDEDFPRAIRDRALLLMVGNSDSRQVTGGWNGTMNMGFAFYGFNIKSIKNQHPEFDVDIFKDWLEEARSYESQNIKVISDEVAWQQIYAYFELGLYDQGQFEQALEQFDWREVSPKYGGSGWNGDSYELDHQRFPYIDDILHGETTGSEVLRQWAREKLVDFIATDDIYTLPEWMQAGTKRSVLNILQPISLGYREGYEEFADALLLAYERYGWDDFFTHKKGSWLDIQRLLKKLPDHLQISLINWTLTNYDQDESPHLDTKTITTLQDQIVELGATHLTPLVKKCLRKSKAQDEKWEKQKTKWAEEQRAKYEKDPKEIAKREARQRYRSLLNTIRNTGNFNQ